LTVGPDGADLLGAWHLDCTKSESIDGVNEGMNTKECHRQYRRGVRAARRYGKSDPYPAASRPSVLPSGESERASFWAGWYWELWGIRR
jgi:hypothetical protein